MDENTNMMIQMASMMMQNQSAIRETQSILETNPSAKPPISKTDWDGDKSTKSNGTNAALAAVAGAQGFGMDPKLMAEFARQVVMNANNKASQETAGQKKTPTKPTTIAQIIQSQAAQTSMANTSSEGKIFVYNNLPNTNENSSPVVDAIKQEPGITSASNVSPQSALTNGEYHSDKGRHSSSSSIGPIRNRYGRVLRPGIDNFGQFEAVTNHGLIMHAMELLRQKDKKKRGPKEKDTFSVFMYCLPDKNSKLPKFSSLDPVERALVDQHQQEGYGYPSIDYINGIPRKTQLCLSYSEAKFHSYMISLYPKMENRLYDMYRIDKTRRLIRVEAKSPRQLKDMKYQGSLIVIPYDQSDDRPCPIIHRNFDDVYTGNGSTTQSIGNPISLMQNFVIPLPSLPETSSNDVSMETMETKATQETTQSVAAFPGISLEQDKQSNITVNGNGNIATAEKETQLKQTEKLFDEVKLLRMAKEAETCLKTVKKIQIRAESVFTDLINAYREDETLENHKIAVCYQNDTGSQSRDDFAIGSLLVTFWEEAFRKHFTGNHHLVPVLDPYSGEDLFHILGRILVHGLILENYVPLRISPACLSFILANSCSDQLSLNSFYQVMSKTEREVLLAALAEAKLGREHFSPRVERSIKTVLGSYGCKSLPLPYELDSYIPNVARSFLLHQPYWALCQIQETFCQSELDITSIAETDIMHVYKVLSYDVPSILQRVNYMHTEDELNLESVFIEEKVKVMFEEYLHKLPNSGIQSLLQQWCGFDCLCVHSLTVCFDLEDSEDTMFEASTNTLHLPGACTSVEELAKVIGCHLPSGNTAMEPTNTWEYTL